MLRRTNSYSYTANEQDKQAAIPPPAVLQNRLSTTSSSSGSNFTRSTEERRSYNSSTLNKTRHRGYKGVLISQATPATVKFSIYNPEVAWIFDMSRPRSPSKGSVSSLDNEVAELDQVLAVVKEQLVCEFCCSCMLHLLTQCYYYVCMIYKHLKSRFIFMQ